MTGPGVIQVGAGGMVVSIKPEVLRAACVHRGWSLAELAKRARISRPTLSQALRGQHIRPSTAYKLAVALSNGDLAPALPGIVGDC